MLLIASGFRIARIGADGLTFDEQWHLELSTGRGSPHVRIPRNEFIPSAPAVTSLKDAPAWYTPWVNMDFVVHPPLYVTLLRIWREIFGEGDIAAKAYSNICQLLAIAMMFLTAHRLNGLRVAVWAGLLYAVAPTQIYLAQQVRGYDQLAAFGMTAAYCIARIQQTKEISWKLALSLGECILGMMLSHYFAIGACLAMAVYALLRFRGQKLVRVIVAVTLSATVYLITWGPFLYHQQRYFAETADPWLIENTPDHLVDTFARLASWCWWLIVRDPASTPTKPMFSAIVLLLPIVLILFKRRDLTFWYLWLFGTLGFIAMLDLFRSTSQLRFERYVSLASPAVMVLIARLAATLPRKLMHVPLAIILSFAALKYPISLIGEAEPDWRPYGQILDQHVGKDEPLIFYYSMDRMTEWKIEVYYLGAAHYSHLFPHSIIKLDVVPMPKPLLQSIPSRTAWLVTGPIVKDVSAIIPGAQMIGDEQYVVPNLMVCTHIKLGNAD